MATFESIAVYIFLFIGIYFQVFVLATYLANRKKIRREQTARNTADTPANESVPSVTIIVPCYNEEKTVGKTIDSLLRLEYPAEKLHISVVDDGSNDNTWAVIQEYKKRFPTIDIYHKENGGKYTAMNYAIARATTDLVGCLDADSFVEADALKKIVKGFGAVKTAGGAMIPLTDGAIAAVTPAMKIYRPTTLVQSVQNIEYVFGIMVKKIQASIDAIHVTPGPFSIFRRDLFQKIGLFRHAHNTEDMEMAFRIQTSGLKIENVHDAIVYTTGPNTFKKLYKQRVRWTSGFLGNLWDYKWIMLNPRYGNVALFTIPIGFGLILGVAFSVVFILYHFGITAWHWYVRVRTIGFTFVAPHFTWNWFFVSTKAHLLLMIAIYAMMTAIVIEAQYLAGERRQFSGGVLLYFVIFPIISPFWIMKSLYNTAFSRSVSWQSERVVAAPAQRK